MPNLIGSKSSFSKPVADILRVTVETTALIDIRQERERWRIAAAAYADSGAIRFNVLKAGFVIGGSAGRGMLVFHGRGYPLAIGGVSYGFTFGASATDFIGRVSNIRTASDVNGVYAAAGAGAAIGFGAGA